MLVLVPSSPCGLLCRCKQPPFVEANPSPFLSFCTHPRRDAVLLLLLMFFVERRFVVDGVVPAAHFCSTISNRSSSNNGSPSSSSGHYNTSRSTSNGSSIDSSSSSSNDSSAAPTHAADTVGGVCARVPQGTRERFVFFRGVQWAAPDINSTQLSQALMSLWPTPFPSSSSSSGASQQASASPLVAHAGVAGIAQVNI